MSAQTEPRHHGLDRDAGRGYIQADQTSPMPSTQRRSYTVGVNPDVARKIKGPGMQLDEFFREVRDRRFLLDRNRGIGMQRNKDVFLNRLAMHLGRLAESFEEHHGELLSGHKASVQYLINIAAEASLMAEWDARAGHPQ